LVLLDGHWGFGRVHLVRLQDCLRLARNVTPPSVVGGVLYRQHRVEKGRCAYQRGSTRLRGKSAVTHGRSWSRSSLARHLFKGRCLALVGAVVMLMIAPVAHIVVPLTLARVVDGVLGAGARDAVFKC